MNNPSQTKDMNLTQLLEDWIDVQDTHPTNLRTKYRNELRAELRASLPSLLAKIEQHVLEARKDARIEGAIMGARFGNAAFRQANIANPSSVINLDETLRVGIEQATKWAESKS